MIDGLTEWEKLPCPITWLFSRAMLQEVKPHTCLRTIRIVANRSLPLVKISALNMSD